MHIGILQAGHAPSGLQPETGDYADQFEHLLAGRGFEFSTYNVVDGLFPERIDVADGWLITGSRHGAYEALPWIPALETLIREIVAAEQPLVGVCFGHQIIAQALGGKVEKFRDGWAVGRQSYTFDGAEIALNAWHQDQVVSLPAGAEVVGSNRFCAYAALRYGPSVFTIQPHPEFNADMVAGLIELRGRNLVPTDLLERAHDALSAPTDSPKLADYMSAVLRAESNA